MRVRIKDIAEKANVSIGTVDRVLHNRGEVSPGTRKKILGIIHKLKYEPDILARALKSNKNYIIAVIIPGGNLDNHFWQEPLDGIKEGLNEISHYGFAIKEFLFNQFDKSSFITCSDLALAEKPDAILIAPVFYQESMAFLDKCSSENIPFLLINSNINHDMQLSFIGQNSERSGRVAAQLMGFELRKKATILIVNIAREKDNYNHILKREQGFAEYFRNRECYTDVKLIRRDINTTDEHIIIEKLSKTFNEIDNVSGIFVTNSRVHKVARFLMDEKCEKTKLIGYDLIGPNIDYMKSGIIDFLISQKPKEQGYKGIISLFNHFVMNRSPEPVIHIPIDIITSENLEYYIN